MIHALILAAALNPVVDLFPKEITFYCGYNDGTPQPEIGLTTLPPTMKQFHVADDGLIGGCLDAGMPRFAQDSAQPLIDTTRPGSIVLWVRLQKEQQPIPRGLAKWEGGGGLFEVVGAEGRRILVMKSVDHQWNDGAVWVFFEGKDETGAHFSVSAATRCSFVGWEVGEWRMISAAWNAEKLFISVNGKPYVSRPYGKKIGALNGPLSFRASYWKGEGQVSDMFAIDECMVFSKKLSDDEVAQIYERTLAAVRKVKGEGSK